MTGDRPRQWLRWLPWAEYVYNTTFHSSLKETPFRVVYGRDPPTLRSYDHGEIRVTAVTRTMAECPRKAGTSLGSHHGYI